jgi:pSer/pThr/pTyr-binding forkhead associated (FHA) protein
MRTDSATDIQVTLTLQRGEDILSGRSITFKNSSGSLQVGRASKTERKQLVPADDNLWISNPVISREHAVLSVERNDLDVSISPRWHETHAHKLQTPLVFLEDPKSSHGTFVNKINIKDLGKRVIVSGDEIQFGDQVLRGQGKL